MEQTLTRVVVFLAFALLGWWFVGNWLNRRRANALARVIYHAVPVLGQRATIRPVGSGSAGFHIEIQDPVPGVRWAALLCLLEARDFPLAWIYTRLRGRRDTVILRVDFATPPKEEARPDPRTAGAQAGLRRVIAFRVQPESPHLQLSFGVGGGEEDEIRRAFEFAARLARGEVAPSG
ncbi:hypothetical protein [Caldinitratiruptor microaerophilus]|uniref:DUF2550 family protein n=1 Tax=Caldinitratiruptor microaerophilus TaxID=671077 RepID=A0AA35CNR1_9FIRM|nr:hypothetical protein [Caldinitratiruptor microaerophilus]BDG60972.1 hypothetical protein caldi_20620 [Caldinitratiruptor microaerophilus]